MAMMYSKAANPLRPRQSQTQLEGGCPNGGKWYACSELTFGFVGCCTVNPCTSVGCAVGNLRAASLGDIAYGSAPDQACQAGGQFFTCTGPSFWGCCKTNPCASGVGCPQDSVAPAALVESPDNPFRATATTGSGSRGSSTSSGSDGGSGTPTGAIVGGVVGGVALLAIIGVLIWYLRRKKVVEETAAPVPPMFQQGPSTQYQDGGQNTPLTYPEVADPYAPKRPLPPSSFQSPALPAYNDRRMSYELGNSEASGLISPTPGSPGYAMSNNGQGQGMRPMSHELVGSPMVGGTPSVGYTPSLMSAPVSELPGESIDMRYSQVSSNMRYSTVSGMSPAGAGGNTTGEPTGLGVTMPEEGKQ
ncbi:hypothetical protein DRE_05989 [Drechslerella stenobrocha 248]|uniref:Mid2 domain-containing protein n=1 Tax=Drechslerella stenobrocha 248 TaxID=1043628 RepID=W7HYK7_9PEZI|nr:hypothetical protein DRE_05989 [Drechslerella stenobrocha 248]